MRLIAIVVLFTVLWDTTTAENPGRLDQFLGDYCVDCHNADALEGGLDLSGWRHESDLYREHEIAREVARVVREGEMPPPGSDGPSPDAQKFFADWVRDKLDHPDPRWLSDPGYLPAHRLNRTQYRNTVRDLIGLGTFVADNLLPDESAEGFDTIATVAELTPMHLERMVTAAETLVDLIFVGESSDRRWEAETLSFANAFGAKDFEKDVRLPDGWPSHDVDNGFLRMFRSGSVSVSVNIPQTGFYRVGARLYSVRRGGKIAPRMQISVDGHAVNTLSHLESRSSVKKPRSFDKPILLRAGKHDLTFTLEGIGWNGRKGTTVADDLNCLGVDHLYLVGPEPEDAGEWEAARDRILSPGFSDDDDDAARLAKVNQILNRFASRAFRRRVSVGERRSLVAQYQAAVARGHDSTTALKQVIQAILVSPRFLMHWEAERAPGEVHRIDGFELASRLSYFLWSSMPDRELFLAADSGRLHEPEVLTAQVKRMLADDKARSLAENFAPQWLGMGSLFNVDRNGRKYPDFHRNRVGVRQAMHDEVVWFADELFRGNQSVMNFIEADFTYVNDRLAPHYGLSDVKGRSMQRVSTVGTPRGGLLTMSGILMSVSHPGDTNPSGRGKWILDTILGTPPPPPPPDVEPLPESDRDTRELTLRQRLALHRDNPACASCHQKIDALGFALDRFDQNGVHRDHEDGKPLDTASTVADGTRINGIDDLKKYLVEHQGDLFRRELSRRLMLYALRRPLAFADTPTLNDCVQSLRQNDDRFEALVMNLVQSDAFQKRKTPLNAEP